MRKNLKIKSTYHLFGHIHSAYGIEKSNDTIFINAGLINEMNELVKTGVKQKQINLTTFNCKIIFQNMRNLKMKTVNESPDLVKVGSNQTPASQFPKDQILDIIDNAKGFEKGKSIDTLRQIVENYSKKEYSTKLGAFSEEIGSIGETAYQRAILSEKTQLHSLGEIVWNDLELPVVFNESSRRNCVDLVGILNNETPVLCELKFAPKEDNLKAVNSGSPIYAAIELLIYYYLIKENYEELDKKEVFHKNGKPFKWKDFNHDPILIVGANKSYWDVWKNQYEERKIDLESWRNSLPLSIRFFSSADFDFKNQKEIEGAEGKYTPSISGKTEWKEEFTKKTQG